METIKIVIFATGNGKKPFLEWLHELDGPVRAIVRTRLDRVALGNFGDCKAITNGGGVRELRINYGSGYRIYFGIKNKALVILLAGGDKKTQQKDITRAKEYWLECEDSYE
jgi:putative addiction module killer protein